jgi:hypothetical protein
MTTHKPWLYSHNTFMTATAGNFTLTDKLNSNHAAGLKAEALVDLSVAPRATAFEAVQQHFHTEYVNHLQLTGEIKAATQLVNKTFHDLGTKLSKAWVHTIAGVYPEDSEGYVRILPKGRKVLYNGIFTQRLAALDALALSLSTEAAPLDDLHTTITTFITSFKSDIQKQKDLQEKFKASSANLESLRITSMNLMYSDLGFFISKYPSSPKDIERTFDLTSIRHFALAAEENANEYILNIAAGHQVEGGIALTPNMKLMFTNLTSLPLKIYLSNSNNINQDMPENVYTLAGEAEEELFISQIGDPAFRYMFIVNENSTENAELSIMIIN